MGKRDLHQLASRYFICDTGLSKANLIRKIQIEQGHADCFATGKTECEQAECWWRKDCLAEEDGSDRTDVIIHVKGQDSHDE